MTEELGVHRNASREDHRPWHDTNYYVRCPTEGCRGRISGYAKATVQQPFTSKLFSWL